MVALVAPDRNGFVEWTSRGIELAERHDAASYWAGPLLNNLGWDQFDAGEYEAALDTFRQALAERERDPENRAAVAIARYAVAKALRALGQNQEAAAELERAVAWTEAEGKPDGWFHEELAESYDALGRASEARENAVLALPLLLEADPAFKADTDRVARLRELASIYGDLSGTRRNIT
jgi:tetratricopeptide (TPR) repeat protein